MKTIFVLISALLVFACTPQNEYQEIEDHPIDVKVEQDTIKEVKPVIVVYNQDISDYINVSDEIFIDPCQSGKSYTIQMIKEMEVKTVTRIDLDVAEVLKEDKRTNDIPKKSSKHDPLPS